MKESHHPAPALALPEHRPALAAVMSMPPDWVTPSERLILIALALDSYDGQTCAPGRDALMRFAGIRHVQSFMRARDALTSATALRPPLLAVDSSKGRRSRYQLLFANESQTTHAVPVSESQTTPPETQPVSESQTTSTLTAPPPVSESQTTSEVANLSAEPVCETCLQNLSAEPVCEMQTTPFLSPSDPEEEGEEEEAGRYAAAPEGAPLAPVVSIASAHAQKVDYLTASGVLTKQLKAQWHPDHFSFQIVGGAREALKALIKAGWTLEQLQALASTIGKPTRNPSGLVRSHFEKALNFDPADYTPAPTPPDEEASEAPAAASKGKRKGHKAKDASNDAPAECDHGVPRGHQCRDCEEEDAELFVLIDRARELGLVYGKDQPNDEVYVHLISGNGGSYGVNFIYDETRREWCEINAWWLGGASDMRRLLHRRIDNTVAESIIEDPVTENGQVRIEGPLKPYEIVNYLAPLVNAMGQRWAEDKRAKAKYGIAY